MSQGGKNARKKGCRTASATEPARLSKGQKLSAWCGTAANTPRPEDGCVPDPLEMEGPSRRDFQIR